MIRLGPTLDPTSFARPLQLGIIIARDRLTSPRWQLAMVNRDLPISHLRETVKDPESFKSHDPGKMRQNAKINGPTLLTKSTVSEEVRVIVVPPLKVVGVEQGKFLPKSGG